MGGTYSDDALPGTGGRPPKRTTTIGGYQTQLEPDERGMKLRFGGEFGPVGRKEGGVQRVEELVWGRETGGSRRPRPWMDVAKVRSIFLSLSLFLCGSNRFYVTDSFAR